MTHAFFKALLFLGAGSVIHALSGEQDIGKMGAWRKSFRGRSSLFPSARSRLPAFRPWPVF